MANAALRSLLLAELSAFASGMTAGGLHQLAKLKMPATALGDVRDELGALHDAGFVAYADNPIAPQDRELRQWAITQTGALALKK